MTSLLSRLQSLTGPDREVHAEIAMAAGWRQLSHDLWVDAGGQCHIEPPRYTESMDAALMLVPASAQWEVGSNPDDGGYMSTIYVDTGNDIAVCEGFTDVTPAIALLIAWAKMMESASALSGKEE